MRFASAPAVGEGGPAHRMDRSLPSRTTTALLAALADPNDRTARDAAWRELLDRCEPIMLGVAKAMGASATDAADLVQTSLVAFLEAWRQGRYDRSRGRVSRFLASILRARYLDLRRSRLRRDDVSLDACEDLARALSDESVDRAWRVERQRTILARALAQLRADGIDERTLEAFELYAVRGVDVEAVVERVGMSRGDVYSIKYRLVRRLQPIVARLDELYEDL